MLREIERDSYILTILLIIVGVIGWFVQDQFFINWDVAQLLNATQLMLQGGKYGSDIFVPNPPSVLLLYSLPTLISSLFKFNLVYIFRAYIFLVSTLSLLLCFYFTNAIFSKEDRFVQKIFLITIAITFFILPFHQLGQRDCLVYVLIFPYLLLTVLRLQKNHVSLLLSLCTGALAAIGVSIKPQFLIFPVLIESYYLIRTKKWSSFFRPEVLTTATLLIAYSLCALIFFPSYILDVVPYFLKNYYACIANPWRHLIQNNVMLYVGLITPFLFFQLKTARYYNLSTILLIALIGFIISYFSQRTLFLYHVLPILFITMVISTLHLFCLMKNKVTIYDYIVYGLMSYFAWISFIYSKYHLSVLTILYPQLFFSFYIILFSMLLYAAQPEKKIKTVILNVIIIITLGYLMAFLTQSSDLYSYTTLFTLLIMISVFMFLTNKKNEDLAKQVFLLITMNTIFIPIIYITQIYYLMGLNYKNHILTPLIYYAEQQPPKTSIYVLSSLGNYNYPLMYYANVQSIGRFDSLWMLSSLLEFRELHNDHLLRSYIKNNHDNRFFINMIAEDLEKNKPDLVMVDVRDKNTVYHGTTVPFDILGYFLENEYFRTQMSHYYFDSVIKDSENLHYKLAIYKRIKE